LAVHKNRPRHHSHVRLKKRGVCCRLELMGTTNPRFYLQRYWRNWPAESPNVVHYLWPVLLHWPSILHRRSPCSCFQTRWELRWILWCCGWLCLHNGTKRLDLFGSYLCLGAAYIRSLFCGRSNSHRVENSSWDLHLALAGPAAVWIAHCRIRRPL